MHGICGLLVFHINVWLKKIVEAGKRDPYNESSECLEKQENLDRYKMRGKTDFL